MACALNERKTTQCIQEVKIFFKSSIAKYKTKEKGSPELRETVQFEVVYSTSYGSTDTEMQVCTKSKQSFFQKLGSETNICQNCCTLVTFSVFLRWGGTKGASESQREDEKKG